MRSDSSLSLFSLFFLKKARRTTKKKRIFYPYRTAKIPGKKGKNAKKTTNFSQGKKNKEFQKNKERKDTDRVSSTESRIARFPKSRAKNRQTFHTEKQKKEPNRNRIAEIRLRIANPKSESQPVSPDNPYHLSQGWQFTPSMKTPEIAAICETRESNAVLRFKGAMESRQRFAISGCDFRTQSYPFFCRISGDLAPSTRKSLAIAIVRFSGAFKGRGSSSQGRSCNCLRAQMQERGSGGEPPP